MSTPAADIERIFMEKVQYSLKWSIMVVGSGKDILDYNTDINNEDSHVHSYELTYKANYYVIVIDSNRIFQKKIVELSRMASWNPRAYVVVFSSERFDSQASLNKYSEAILTHLWRYYILYGVIFLQDVKVRTKFQVISWNPYDPPTRCGNSSDVTEGTAKLYDVCEKGNLSFAKNIFGEKLPPNLKGCKLKTLSPIMPPFINSPNDTSPGIERTLLDTIGQKYNYNIQHTLLAINRGERKDNQWNGVMEMLVEKDGEIAIGGIYPDNEIHEDFEGSISYLQDSYTWVVPRAKEMARWKALVIIFSSDIWLSVIGVYFVCVLVWFTLANLSNESQYQTSLRHCVANTLYMFFGGAAYSRPVFHTVRILFVFFSIYTVLLITAYQTKLITVLTESSFEVQIDRMDEILESDLKYGGLEEQRDLFEHTNITIDTVIFEKYIELESADEALHQVVTDRNFSLLISRMHLKALASKKSEFNDKNGDPAYHIFSENIFSIPLEMVTLKGFPYMEKFNHQISMIKSNGLMSKWGKDLDIEIKKKAAQEQRIAAINQVKELDQDIRLSLEHLQGGFLILAVGFTMGAIVLCFELFSKTFVCLTMREIMKLLFYNLFWRKTDHLTKEQNSRSNV